MSCLRILHLLILSFFTQAYATTTNHGPNHFKVALAGINMVGFDFGDKIDGSWVASELVDIVTHGTAIQQMQHFVSVGLNTFRLPVPWQYLVNNQLGGTLDPTNFGAYDKLVQGCLDAGSAMCIIDIHNYARWNGLIIGQNNVTGGPQNTHLSSLWWQLAAWYKDDKRVAFGIMNEPHDLDVDLWAESVQWAVNSIRNATACNDHIVLLPGTTFCSAGAFIPLSSVAMSRVYNPGGGTENLVSLIALLYHRLRDLLM